MFQERVLATVEKELAEWYLLLTEYKAKLNMTPPQDTSRVHHYTRRVKDARSMVLSWRQVRDELRETLSTGTGDAEKDFEKEFPA